MTANVLRLRETDSTNLEARRLIEGGERGPLWIVADHQTAGRGRFERHWQSPLGNLHTSLILRPGRPLKEVAILSLLAGVAVHQMVSLCAPGVPALLKWPNDVLLDGAKLAGILLETTGPSEDPTLIIGIGVNVSQAPEGLPHPTSCMAKYQPGIEVEAVFNSLKNQFESLLQTFRDQGFAPIREKWLANTVRLGTPIKVRLPDQTLEGDFGGMDESGALLLNRPEGPLAIMAGDVFFAPFE